MNRYQILIPIYNAHSHVKKCLSSVLSYTAPYHSVVLLDDASTDKKLVRYLNSIVRKNPHFTLIRSIKNKGFVRTSNRGFDLSRKDIILLNSDTIVCPNWVEQLDAARKSRVKTGMVSPVSNNGGYLSVPKKLFNPKRLPLHPLLPFAAGFCVLMTRKMLDKVGKFDTAFGMGYGEIYDLSLRARKLGFKIVCSDDTFIFHHEHASFKQRADFSKIYRRGSNLLDLYWPEFSKELRNPVLSKTLVNSLAMASV